MEIVAVIDYDQRAKGLQLARKYHIPTSTHWKEWLTQSIDIIIEATGDERVLEELLAQKESKTIVIPGTVAYIISELFEEKESLLDRDRKSTRLNSSHVSISYAVFCLKKKKIKQRSSQ